MSDSEVAELYRLVRSIEKLLATHLENCRHQCERVAEMHADLNDHGERLGLKSRVRNLEVPARTRQKLLWIAATTLVTVLVTHGAPWLMRLVQANP